MDKSIATLFLKINIIMALKGKILLETSTIIKQDIPYIAGPN